MGPNTIYIIKCLILLLSTTLVASDDCTVSDYNKVPAAIKECTTLTVKDMIVPANATLLLDLQSGTKLYFSGNITFAASSPALRRYYLITIRGDNLNVLGHTGHILDGQGDKYWHGRSTDIRPYFMSIEATNSVIKYLHLLNSPSNCVSVRYSTNLHLSNFIIDNRDGDPGNRPEGYEAKNTDGFDVNTSENVTIKHSLIYNQDDCVGISNGKNYLIDDLECHGSHGLSFSVAFGNRPVEQSTVRNATFKNCRMIGGANGIHLKNHNTAGPGLMEDINYHNISLKDVERVGIQIQENYPSGNATSNVLINNLKISNVYGTMSGKKSRAVQIICGSTGCANFTWKNINITGAYLKNECNYKPGGFSC